MKKYKKAVPYNLILLSCLLSGIVSAATVSETWGLGRIVDSLTKNVKNIMPLVLFVLGMVVLQYLGNTINIRLEGIIIQKTGRDLRCLLSQKVITIDYEKLQKIHTGNLNSMFISDVDAVKNFEQILMGNIGGVVAAIVSIGVCAKISWKFLIICILFFPVILWLGSVFNKNLHNYAYQTKVKMGNSGSRFLNSVQNIDLIKAYSVENYIGNKYADVLQEEKQAVLKELSAKSRVSLLNRLTGAVPYMVIFITGAILIWTKEISLGSFFAFAYIFSNIQSIQNLQEIISASKSYKAAKQRISELLLMPDEIYAATSNSSDKNNKEDGIYFENVSFSYENGKKVFSDIALDIKAGHPVAFIGESGAGKSTLIGLLTGLYSPQAGRIIFSKKGKCMLPQDYRRFISVVFQDNHLFSSTISENIKMGYSEASEADIEQACRRAGIWEDIQQMPQGIYTRISEMGSSLSGGQRQRICIARALVKNPDILIMDEPSASLDTANEQEIMQRLIESMKDKILIIISHRVSTVKYADIVYEVKDTKISQKGTWCNQ